MRRRTRNILLALLAIVVTGIAALAIVFAPFLLRTRHVHAEPGAGFHADYFVYVSPGARDRAVAGKLVTILVQPNNSGTNSDDPNVHIDDAWWTTYGRSSIADELEVILLVPAFIRPAKDWKIYTHALDRDVLLTTDRVDLRRLDLQLIAMIDHARAPTASPRCTRTA